jgi:hypothetical protein
MANDRESTSLETGDENAMVPVFSSSNHDAEMEAMAIKGVMDANDIPSMIVGPHILPNLEFQVQVSAEDLERARQTIREARQDGRRAADEGELASEG